MSSGADRARASAEAALGHVFSEPRLLDQALGHSGRLQGRSDGPAVPSHERLEFLGDRVLGLIVASTLLDRYPRDAEGVLNLRLVALVRGETLAEIAALYLDGGLPAAEVFVRRHWAPLLDRDPRPPRDAKTTLQEWAQARSLGLPVYRLVATEGPDHAPQFDVEVAIGGKAPAAGQGATKRAAEQMAAERLLEKLGVRRHG